MLRQGHIMNQSKFAFQIQLLISLCGGYMATYSLLSFDNLLASAQTANLINLVSALFGGNTFELLERIGALLIYFFAMTLTVVLQKRLQLNLKVTSIFISLISTIIVSLLPHNKNIFVTIYPLIFALAFQWCAFKELRGRSVSTIFSTNNLRQFTLSITEYYYTKDPLQLETAKIFGFVLVFFHLGVISSYILYIPFSKWSILGTIFPLLLVLLLLVEPVEIKEPSNS